MAIPCTCQVFCDQKFWPNSTPVLDMIWGFLRWKDWAEPEKNIYVDYRTFGVYFFPRYLPTKIEMKHF